ncbi:MAG: DUF2970 domain-containing protein [Betaproteobacteria bacterium]
MTPTPPPEPPRQATLRQIAAVVFWSFFGVRKGHAMQRDAVTIKPVQIIIAGVITAALIVAGLLLLVRFIISHA